MIRNCVAVLIVASALLAQGEQKPPPNCTVIGASLSNGTSLKVLAVMLGIRDLGAFAKRTLGRDVGKYELRVRSDSIGLRPLLRKIARDDIAMLDCSDTMFFRQPVKKGERQLKRAARRGGLVLGIDFMFWFGYGGIWGGAAKDRAARRLAKQAKAFELLETHLLKDGVTLVMGDYPNMAGAEPRMLPRSSIPSPETLAELNRRLHAWAADKSQVHVYPLAKSVAAAKRGKLSLPAIGVETSLRAEQLMQLDLLHPTKLGTALITTDLLRYLDRTIPTIARQLPFERKLKAIFAKLDLSEAWQRIDELKPAVVPAKAGSGGVEVRVGK